MQRIHAHEGGLHEGSHRGTITLADDLTLGEGTGPFPGITDVFMLHRWTFTVALFFREQES
jgi:hypothetical protein